MHTYARQLSMVSELTRSREIIQENQGDSLDNMLMTYTAINSTLRLWRSGSERRAGVPSRITRALATASRMPPAKVTNANRNNVVFFEHLFLGVGQADLNINTSAGMQCLLNEAFLGCLYCKEAAAQPYLPFARAIWSDMRRVQVGDMDIAHTFYEEGLGLVYDPSVKSGQKKGVGVSWLNIGDQQVRHTAV